MKRSKELFESDPAKREHETVSRLPHTEESREEEERLNPARHAAKSKGYRGPYKNIEEVADTRLNPEEELIAREKKLSREDHKEINDEAEEKQFSERLREEDYPEYHGSREKWEQYLRSLPNQNYAAWLRAKFLQTHSEVVTQPTRETRGERQFERKIPDSLLQQPKQEKITHLDFGWDSHKMGKSSKKIGKEKNRKISYK